MKKYDLTVAYRIYPKVSKVPPIFADDKLKLAEFCVYSFKKSLGDLHAKMFVLLDNCPPEYDDVFFRHFDSDDVEFIRLGGEGNAATFANQIDLLLTQNDSEYIYFAEDDYFYLTGEFSEMLDFLKENSNVDFCSPYDHLDYYTSELHRHKKEEKVFKNRHWHTAGSTCLTFLTTKKVLEESRKVFETYSRKNSDASLWCILTKEKVRNPLTALKFAIKDRALFKIVVKAWLHGTKHLLTARKFKLWTPVPAIATHMEDKYLSPDVNWDEVFKQAKEELHF
ncbi:MAG: glycosyltransferase family 2 protein [Bacteroidota bacterium]